jgi:hypothetical protein
MVRWGKLLRWLLLAAFQQLASCMHLQLIPDTGIAEINQKNRNKEQAITPNEVFERERGGRS